MKYQDTRTELGFRDISSVLRAGFDDLRQFDVIRGIMLEQEVEQSHDDGSKSYVYYFRAHNYDMRGRVFPRDEIVKVRNVYDVIIQENHPGNSDFGFNVDANVYHDFKIGECFPIRISRASEDRNPSFKLFNRIAGFVKRGEDKVLYQQIQEGIVVIVEVKRVVNKRGRINIEVNPLRIIPK